MHLTADRASSVSAAIMRAVMLPFMVTPGLALASSRSLAVVARVAAGRPRFLVPLIASMSGVVPQIVPRSMMALPAGRRSLRHSM